MGVTVTLEALRPPSLHKAHLAPLDALCGVAYLAHACPPGDGPGPAIEAMRRSNVRISAQGYIAREACKLHRMEHRAARRVIDNRRRKLPPHLLPEMVRHFVRKPAIPRRSRIAAQPLAVAPNKALRLIPCTV